MSDTFTSKISAADLEAILPSCSEFGVDPTSSRDAEDYFSSVIPSAATAGGSVLAAVAQVLGNDFRSLAERPIWIQGSDWQFDGGLPMHFVGQIHCERASGAFHDDAAFYVFWSPKTGATKTVIQVA